MYLHISLPWVIVDLLVVIFSFSAVIPVHYLLPFFLIGHQVRGFKESPDTKGACSFTEENLPQDIN